MKLRTEQTTQFSQSLNLLHQSGGEHRRQRVDLQYFVIQSESPPDVPNIETLINKTYSRRLVSLARPATRQQPENCPKRFDQPRLGKTGCADQKSMSAGKENDQRLVAASLFAACGNSYCQL